MDLIIGILVWVIVLFGCLLPLPGAVARRESNHKRFRAVSWISALYVTAQGTLIIWIYGFLPRSSPDWLHALALPFMLGVATFVVMLIALALTKNTNAA